MKEGNLYFDILARVNAKRRELREAAPKRCLAIHEPPSRIRLGPGTWRRQGGRVVPQ